MFVLCEECKNHYDDSWQSSECSGVGASARPQSAHNGNPDRKPITEHHDNLRRVR